jgi:hypothetical protein
MLAHVSLSSTWLTQVQFPCFYHLLSGALGWSQLVTRQLSMQPVTISLILMDSSTLVPLCVVYRGFRVSPTYRRTLGQCTAHLALSVGTPEAANILIRDRMYICRTVAHPRKLKTEPKQCMKCRKWGHFVAECLEEKDACGNCAEGHHTKDCPDKNRRYRVSCQNDTHMSWDRSCPEFKCRVEQMDESHPENALTYFPNRRRMVHTSLASKN